MVIITGYSQTGKFGSFWKKEFGCNSIDNETERIILLRSLLVSYYADIKRKKLVVGIFNQRPQAEYEHTSAFAEEWDLVFGVETIYCVKDVSIIQNIR
jgi:hypothetical protein